jgi:hypothetical protein
VTLDNERADAQMRRDFAALDRVLADDLTYIHASGLVQNKAEFIADLKSNKRIHTSIKFSDLNVRLLQGVAVITGHSEIHVLPASANDLTLHAYHHGGCVLSASTNMRDFSELPDLNPALELLPDLGIGGFPYAAHQGCFNNRPLVLYSRPLEEMIARPGHGPLRLHLWLPHLVLPMLARLCDDAVRLMPVLCGQFAVPL